MKFNQIENFSKKAIRIKSFEQMIQLKEFFKMGRKKTMKMLIEIEKV